jgi:hypothetical protein
MPSWFDKLLELLSVTFPVIPIQHAHAATAITYCHVLVP